MATFCVVIFPCDNTVDIVRESWLCGLNDDFEELCKFPPVKGDRKKLQNLLLQQEEPHPSWQEYVIVAKRTGIGKNYFHFLKGAFLSFLQEPILKKNTGLQPAD